jgi:hypothetical protein
VRWVISNADAKPPPGLVDPACLRPDWAHLRCPYRIRSAYIGLRPGCRPAPAADICSTAPFAPLRRRIGGLHSREFSAFGQREAPELAPPPRRLLLRAASPSISGMEPGAERRARHQDLAPWGRLIETAGAPALEAVEVSRRRLPYRDQGNRLRLHRGLTWSVGFRAPPGKLLVQTPIPGLLWRAPAASAFLGGVLTALYTGSLPPTVRPTACLAGTGNAIFTVNAPRRSWPRGPHRRFFWRFATGLA